MATLEISFDEVLAEIDRLSTISPEGFTMQDMASATGHNVKWCRERIALLINSGGAICNGRAKRPRIDGQFALVPVYLIKKE